MSAFVEGMLPGTAASAGVAKDSKAMQANRLLDMTARLSAPQARGKPIGASQCRRVGQAVAALLLAAPGTALAEEAALRSGPFSLDAAALVDGLAVAGGVAGGTRVAARADLVLDYDGASGGVPWLSGQLDLTGIAGRSISALVGDVQGVSSNEFPDTLRVTNAWVQASGSRASLKLGIIDSNADFDEQNVGAIFVHSSHGTGPELSGAGLDGAGATPNTTLGVVAAVFDADAGWKLRGGLFNGRPGDPDHPGQPSFAFSRGIGVLAIGEADWTKAWGRIAVGGWHFTSTLPALDGSGDRRGASGGFVTLEPNLIKRDNGLQLQGWVRAGIGDAATDAVRSYIGGGLVASGMFPDHPDDAVGFAVAHARMNGRAGPGAGAETAFEWTFQHKLTCWLTVQPDVQWVVNPGGFGSTENAVVAGLRLVLTKSVF
jgi:porin